MEYWLHNQKKKTSGKKKKRKRSWFFFFSLLNLVICVCLPTNGCRSPKPPLACTRERYVLLPVPIERKTLKTSNLQHINGSFIFEEIWPNVTLDIQVYNLCDYCMSTTNLQITILPSFLFFSFLICKKKNKDNSDPLFKGDMYCNCSFKMAMFKTNYS